MKKVFFALPFLLLSQIAISQTNSLANNKFFSIILEVDQDENGMRSAKLITSQIHEGRLKRPTLSEQADNVLLIQFLDHTNKNLHQLTLDNSLMTDYEYVNKDEQLTHVMLPENKKSYHIRIPFDPNIVSMNVYLNNGSDDKLISSFMLQNN